MNKRQAAFALAVAIAGAAGAVVPIHSVAAGIMFAVATGFAALAGATQVSYFTEVSPLHGEGTWLFVVLSLVGAAGAGETIATWTGSNLIGTAASVAVIGAVYGGVQLLGRSERRMNY